MKLISWNVNGIRAITKKNFFESVKEMNPDVLCLQETKAQDDQVAEALENLEGYEVYSNSAEKKGYSGTAILTKSKSLSIIPDIGIEEHDNEGRVLTAEFGDFYLITAYVPNSGSGLKRLNYRQEWDKALLGYINKLRTEKPVIICGDLNVAHRPIDLTNDKANYNKTAGYMQEEIDGMDHFLASGLVDSFRYFHPNKEKYSWWSYRMNARARNIGWRIDYFLVSEDFISNVEESFILNEHLGSDHCPVGITLKS